MKKNEPLLIKKYENRRLYDTTNSRYVNLDEVARMLQGGSEVRVVDAASGEDLTRLILTQIILEDAKGPNSSFPIEILRDMVIASGRASQESAVKYMNTMFDLYRSTYQAMAPRFNPAESVKTQDNPRTRAQAAGASVPEEDDIPIKAVTPPSEVSELKKRLADLEAIVRTLPAASAPRKRRK